MLRDRGLARGRRRDVFELTELRFWALAGVANHRQSLANHSVGRSGGLGYDGCAPFFIIPPLLLFTLPPLFDASRIPI